MSENRFKLSDWCGEQNVSNVIDIEKQTHLINVEVVELLNEQQATISQLQDLCGQSDGENAKLRIENKRLQEEIERLQKIIDLTQYQLKVQDRILKEVGE